MAAHALVIDNAGSLVRRSQAEQPFCGQPACLYILSKAKANVMCTAQSVVFLAGKGAQPTTLCNMTLATADHSLVSVLEFGFRMGLTFLALET